MRRRGKPGSADDPNAVPPELARYNPADWPPSDCPVCAFYAAFGEWSEAHPDAPLPVIETWPDDPWECAVKRV